LSEEERAENATESLVDAEGEHPFLVMKLIFGLTNGRYRGLAKKRERVQAFSTLAKPRIGRRFWKCFRA
jgi:hypothetical protein